MNDKLLKMNEIFRKCWTKTTGFSWSEENRALGQANVSSIVVFDIFGGTLMKTWNDDSWHYYNFILGQRYDFTISQFDQEPNYDDIACSRDEVMFSIKPSSYNELYTTVCACLKQEEMYSIQQNKI